MEPQGGFNDQRSVQYVQVLQKKSLLESLTPVRRPSQKVLDQKIMRVLYSGIYIIVHLYAATAFVGCTIANPPERFHQPLQPKASLAIAVKDNQTRFVVVLLKKVSRSVNLDEELLWVHRKIGEERKIWVSRMGAHCNICNTCRGGGYNPTLSSY